jgi:hypothetical protein
MVLQIRKYLMSIQIQHADGNLQFLTYEKLDLHIIYTVE